MTSLAPVGHPFIELATVDSTNNYAMAQIHQERVTHGTAYFAFEQKKGKGQRGRAWVSEPGQNIILSVVLQPGFNLSHQFLISAITALSCYDFFKSFVKDEVFIKWPNDIYLCDRKAGGILIENVVRGSEWSYAVVGIGLNINQTEFPPGVMATSLTQKTGITYNVVSLAQQLCKRLESRLHENPSPIMKDYNAHLYLCGQMVDLRWRGDVLRTTIKGVDEQGRLMTSDTEERLFEFGDVELILPKFTHESS